MSTPPNPEHTADEASRAAGWAWLAGLPRAVTAHGERGPDPLQATRDLLDALGNPHHGLRAIHLVGSKGKGSTALLIEALLRRLGQRTLTFTSPHLQRWTERLRIDGREADGATALAAIEAVRRAAQVRGLRPGFFEALTVAAFWLAREQDSDWCIVEAGVGGRADATNVITPALVVWTSIELEHVERLGSTLAAIACEKAGAIKPGVPLVRAELAAEALPALDAAARAAAAPVTCVRPQGSTASDGPEQIEWRRESERLVLTGPAGPLRLPCPFPGKRMAGNAALAAAAVLRLGLTSRDELQRAGRAWSGIALPGRLETLSTLPWIVIDSAHTPESTRALAATVRELAPARVTLLLSLSASKDLQAVTDPLMSLATLAVVTRADATYSVASDQLGHQLRARWPETPLEQVEDPGEALARACSAPAPDHLVLVAGSVYLAGRVRALTQG